jgi:predicted pyridoxine 5'-phosphate oxidase superfamily flavin-nucleotide-binding protein
VRDPRIALLFLIPGIGETLRVNGRAAISIAPDLLQRFAINGKLPRSVMLVQVETAFFHCAKAIARARLWDEASKVERKRLPSTGSIIADLSRGELGGEAYDRDLPARIKAQLY